METKKKRKYSPLNILGRELKIIGERKLFYVYVFLACNMLCAGLLPLVGVYMPRIIIDLLVDDASKQRIIITIVFLVGLSFILSAGSVVSRTMAANGILTIRMKEFERVNKIYQVIDYKHLEDPHFRDYFSVSIEALSGDGMGFQAVLTTLVKVPPLLLSMILYIVVISLFNPLITLSCLVSSFIAIIVNKQIAKYIAAKKELKAKYERQKDYFSNLCYDFSYGKEIRVYNLQSKLVTDYNQKSLSFIKVVVDISKRRFLLGLIETIFLLLQDSVAYFLIIYAYYKQGISLGEVSLYVLAVIGLSTTLRTITDYFTDFIKNAEYAKNYFEFLDNRDLYGKDGTRDALPKEVTLDIQFNHVSFKYPNTEKWILKDFTFRIPAGEHLAIVGTNGAGKSTIIKLITGLYKVDEGEILLNGINVNEFKKSELQKMFSVVYQDVNIYAATVLENVIGTATGSENIIKGIDCLNRVGLKVKLESLPNKYDTALLKVIDEQGTELSGGQNQKVSIARALFKDGNMVVLDEPTSALDALAEAEIYKSFDDLVQDKTAIYISHRLSSTKFCSHIALFNQDGLKEYGTHDELMNLKGEYFHMFETQGKYYQEGVDSND